MCSLKSLPLLISIISINILNFQFKIYSNLSILFSHTFANTPIPYKKSFTPLIYKINLTIDLLNQHKNITKNKQYIHNLEKFYF